MILNEFLKQFTIWFVWRVQNYFGDPWNVLDFVIVVGSIVDIAAGRLLVSAAIWRVMLRLVFALTFSLLPIYVAYKLTRRTNAF